MESYISLICGVTGDGSSRASLGRGLTRKWTEEGYKRNVEDSVSRWTTDMNVDVMDGLGEEIAAFITSLLHRWENKIETLYFLFILKVDTLGIIHSMFIVDTA